MNDQKIKKDSKYWLCWIAVLPGAILSAILGSFVLHWVLYFTLSKGEVISGVNIAPIEYYLLPFVASLFFVMFGSDIAPTNKFKTSIFLSILWIVALIIILKYVSGTYLEIRGIVGIIGLIIGIYFVWAKENNSES
mgnify:CR=1 FL=1